MLVSKNPNEPNANPQGPNANHNQPSAGPNVSWWNIVCVVYTRVRFALGMSISCCLSHFCSCWVANENVVSGGIWAVDYDD